MFKLLVVCITLLSVAKAESEPYGPREVCLLPKVIGPCEAAMPRYYFDALTGKCMDFIYGGCKGNSNNFETLLECLKTCGNVFTCDLPKSIGPCKANMTRYFFDTMGQVCREFTYGGCKGNDNNFETLADCQKQCGVPRCEQPMYVGRCRARIPRIYYDSVEGKCKKFFYGGCDANLNNFPTKSLCQAYCPVKRVNEICLLKKEVGSCYALIRSWYYDAMSGKCKQFKYGGCGGNKNRFSTRDMCNARCPVDTVNPICLQLSETGPCFANMKKWFYNSDSGRCQMFTYGGCKGNENRFDTKLQCDRRCPVPGY